MYGEVRAHDVEAAQVAHTHCVGTRLNGVKQAFKLVYKRCPVIHAPRGINPEDVGQVNVAKLCVVSSEHEMFCRFGGSRQGHEGCHKRPRRGSPVVGDMGKRMLLFKSHKCL